MKHYEGERLLNRLDILVRKIVYFSIINKQILILTIKKSIKILTIKKSIKRAIPAYNAKARTAGISDSAPKKKHVASEDEDNNIDGATSPTTRPKCSGRVSEGFLKSL